MSTTTTEKMVLFHGGWPSQWYISPFQDDSGQVYNCCEQYMMSHKAKYFGDDETLKQILDEEKPKEQKVLGRNVRNFDGAAWDKVCDDIVFRANLLKFSQNDELKALLLDTGDKMMVEVCCALKSLSTPNQ